MHPARRRISTGAATIRPVTIHAGAERRGGFTLVEMMVSVTLVLLMMLMFAEIYGMAQEMISKQKGIAENDQKARILTEVLRQDLESRTFRDVYPFKTEMKREQVPPLPAPPTGYLAVSNFPIVDANGLLVERARQVLAERRGYLAFSENDPADDTDDTLSLTVNVGEHGAAGRRLFGKAYSPVAGLVNGQQDGPEFDDGRGADGTGSQGDASGSSPMAEVSYFLRYGNLYRSTLLVRKPYLEGDDRVTPTAIPPLTGTQGRTTPDGFPGSYTANAFWKDFDYSAYRDTNPTGGHQLRFHGSRSLSNDPDDNPAEAYPFTSAGPLLFLPQSLSAPQLRFGHMVTVEGQPLEFLGTLTSSYFADVVADAGDWPTWKADNRHGFFGRFTTQERSDGNMTFPGSDFGPFATGVPAPGDGDGNGLLDLYQNGVRRGVDLMLPNVHGFDIQVWDDIIKDYVDLGHDRMGFNPYTLNPDPEPGFYHISRLRRAYKPATAPLPSDNFHMEHPSLPDDYDFGNRYDTWSPNMYMPTAAPTGMSPSGPVFAGSTFFSRIGRAPYRPLQANPDPNTANFNRNLEPNVLFGDNTLDDDGDGAFYPADPYDPATSTDAEAPLRAIRIVVRYLDPQSGQTRQATIEQSLIE